MDGTIIGQGRFVVPTTITNRVIEIPSGVDWIRVRNYTQTGTVGVVAPGSVGFDFYWQRGMPAGSAMVRYKQVTTNAATDDLIVAGGFTLYDPSGQTQGALPLISAPRATTASTNATQPVVSIANTDGISVGSVVRMSNTAQTDINGIDFVVGAVVANTSVTLMGASNALATAPGAVGGAGFLRIINASELFYPRRRVITKITQMANAQVSTSIAHGLTPGQEIRFNIPAASGMTQLNPNILNNYYPTGASVPAIVVSLVDEYNFTINIDTTSYTAFTFPTIAQQPSSFPQLTPIGEDTATALASPTIQIPGVISSTVGAQINNTQTGILADATVNTGVLGLVLGTGGAGVQLTTAITGPAGTAAADVVYWVAGKSTYGGL